MQKSSLIFFRTYLSQEFCEKKKLDDPTVRIIRSSIFSFVFFVLLKSFNPNRNLTCFEYDSEKYYEVRCLISFQKNKPSQCQYKELFNLNGKMANNIEETILTRVGEI